MLLADIFHAALKAVDPYEAVRFHSGGIRSVYQSGDYNRLIVAGFGKAACPMSKAAEDTLGDLIWSGAAITKYGHCSKPPASSKIKVYEAGHPVPDENGLRGTQEILSLIKDPDEKTLLLCLISGGGSALCVSPYDGIRLEEERSITDLLLRAGANIEELNAVRKHTSRVKGGRLAERAYPSRMIALILSDVLGDKPDVIASGPTSPDPTTYNDALVVLDKYRLMERSPQTVLEVIYRGAAGLLPETPKARNMIFERVENIIIGNNRKALEAAKTKAETLGCRAEMLSSYISGEAGDAGRQLARRAIQVKYSEPSKLPLCLISGGETTVKVMGTGLGGRNTELALAFAIEAAGEPGITLLSAGTDGTDGPTDAAGAMADGGAVAAARAAGIDPGAYLRNNDSYHFFKKTGGLFITGPTGTNVMDLQLLLIQ